MNTEQKIENLKRDGLIIESTYDGWRISSDDVDFENGTFGFTLQEALNKFLSTKNKI